ncbi:hypothetical protein [Xanthobacter sp. 126]|uniref:hypothetical protein n=1 Tax=Xanthobacter sp. 126 TaxID=1131814 RepID=UPI0018CC3D37|nr:hypothetical protein [Xanthobacter sp. 126]
MAALISYSPARFPREFFFRDDAAPISANAANFRSLTAMSARERDAALAAGSLAFEMSVWVRERFVLPQPDLLDLSHERDPAGAARALCRHWAITERYSVDCYNVSIALRPIQTPNFL